MSIFCICQDYNRVTEIKLPCFEFETLRCNFCNSPHSLIPLPTSKSIGGGGIRAVKSGVRLENCVFVNCGTGISAKDSSIKIKNTLIKGSQVGIDSNNSDVESENLCIE